MRLTASAPTRINLAGGTIDIWPLYLFHDGAMTLNAAISLRAHVEIATREDGGILLQSVDTERSVAAKQWSELDGAGELSLLALLSRHFRLENATLTTRGESPAGAGIAGSSALTIACCGALARWTGSSSEPEHLLQVAMNVECQTIRVPTGVQDYRPALYGGIAAVELGVAGVSRVGIDVDPRELEQRMVLAYTGAPRNSGTNNWEITKRHIDGDQHTFDCFERIRDTAVAMRAALDARRLGRGGPQIAVEWDNRKRLAPGVTTPTIDDLIGRAGRPERPRPRSAVPAAAAVCSATGRRRARRDSEALSAGGARLLDYRIESDGLRLWITARSHASCGKSPTCSRSKARTRSRSAHIATAPTSSATILTSLSLLDETGLRQIPGIGKDLAARIREIAQTGDTAVHRELIAEFPADHPRPAAPARRRAENRRAAVSRPWASRRSTIWNGRRRTAGSARSRAWAPRRKQLILKALDERKRFAGRHLLSRRHEVAAALRATSRERAPDVAIEVVGSLRRGCETCGDLDHPRRPARRRSLMDDLHAYPLVERSPRPRRHEVERPPAGRLPGRPPARRRREPRRGAAVLHGIKGAQHRAARSRTSAAA